MKNYGRKIVLHHDKCDVQFIKPKKKGFMRKHMIEKQACCLLLDLVFTHNPK